MKNNRSLTIGIIAVAIVIYANAKDDNTDTQAASNTGGITTQAPSNAVGTDTRVLPNVIGMSLQEGQDTMQAAGFYVLNDKDATGQNRFQVSDRNWVVTDQSPAAGVSVSTNTLITLYAKKIGE
ncbi:PASTA domain-containing protein [Planomonospora parontospora]|uniref:PASTA domain-containing protein n=1 Tax=Planomonospora parontospora TaxID=58119 RepID=UPI0016715FC2|nr:PASTA domain-containing protein [Planomonospora parontospora]